jgi:hypothetical protein
MTMKNGEQKESVGRKDTIEKKTENWIHSACREKIIMSYSKQIKTRKKTV